MTGKTKGIGFLLLLLVIALAITACGEGGGEGGSSHNKGADCLACHGFSIAATIYKDTANTNPCNGTLHLQFLDPATKEVVIDSTQLGDTSDTGNFYIRSASIQGNYDTRIIAGDGTVLAQSVLPHSFTTSYNSGNPADMNNRYSCNACHKSPDPLNGASGSLYVQQNVDKCQ